MDSNTQSSTSPETKTISPPARIADLNSVDQSVSQLLQAASQSISLLSGSPPSASDDRAPTTLANQKSTFKSTVDTYFTLLSRVDVRLRRQIYALEEAGLIHPGSDADAKRGRTVGADGDGQPAVGGGALDASWLNARVGDKVGEGIERELWGKARELVDKIERRRQEDVEMDFQEHGAKEEANGG